MLCGAWCTARHGNTYSLVSSTRSLAAPPIGWKMLAIIAITHCHEQPPNRRDGQLELIEHRAQRPPRIDRRLGRRFHVVWQIPLWRRAIHCLHHHNWLQPAT